MAQLRIATFNLFNLACAEHQCYPGLPACTPMQYAQRIEWMAQAFNRIDADVFLLQEIFHASALAELVAQMERGSDYQTWLVGAEASNVKPRVALLSRMPLLGDAQSIETLPAGCEVSLPGGGLHARFSRPLLKARIALASGRAMTVINTHLKSNLPRFASADQVDDPIGFARAQLRALCMRGAEAVALRKIAVTELAERGEPLIIGGDFNDAATAVSTMIVAGDPHAPFALRHAAQACSDRAAAELKYTVCNAEYSERIDHLLLSAHFSPGAAEQLATVRRVDTFDQHLQTEEHPVHPDDSRESTAPLPLIYPDHAAVCATIVFGEL